MSESVKRLRSRLLAIAVVLGVGLAIHLLLVDFYLNRILVDGFAERTEEQFEAVRDTVDTLVLGHSHAKWGVAAAELGDAFNLALDGQTLPETYFVLKSELAEPGLDLKAIVLAADSVSFSDWQIKGIGFRHWYAPRVDYLEIGWRRGQPIRYGVTGLLGRYAPYVGMRSDIYTYLETGGAPQLPYHMGQVMERGSFLAKGSFGKLSETERAEAARRRMGIHYPKAEFDEVAGEYFRKTLELARDRGIFVVVVRFPLTKEYLQASRFFLDASRLNERVDEILADHPEVTLVDARLDYATRPKLFIDPDHLNGTGARRFTRRLRAVLENRRR